MAIRSKYTFDYAVTPGAVESPVFGCCLSRVWTCSGLVGT